MRYGVVILGAGGSRRMGRPKLTLPWDGGVIVEHLVRQWRGLDASQIAIVLSNDNEALLEVLDQIKFSETQRIVNSDPERGMFSSIQCAGEWPGWESGLTHVVITLGDQPHLKRSTLKSLLAAGADRAGALCQPSYSGRPKHPVLLPWADFDEIRNSRQPTRAHFSREREARLYFVEVSDPGLNLDIDTPEDYHRAVELMEIPVPSSTVPAPPDR